MTRQNLIGYTLEDCERLVGTFNQPSFRARQLHSWIYVHTVRDFEAMSNLSKTFRADLSTQYQIGEIGIASKDISQDGTIKYLFRLSDGQMIESVLMPFDERGVFAVCLSTQVGCAVNCDFCATGKIGFKRQLAASEIVEQLLLIRHDAQQEVKNIVLMGQGEPLLNYEETLKAIRLLNQSAEIGMRHITLSTSGIIPAIYKLADEKLQLTLAISLHAPDNETRNLFMPINQKYPLEKLLPAIEYYIETTGRRVTIEYILLEGVNDSPEHAHKLNTLLRHIKCLINLIPYNPIGEQYGYKRPSRKRVQTFRDILLTGPNAVTVRLERGADIAAACGQLHNQMKQKFD